LAAFTYYAAQGGNDPYHLPLNAFTSFLDDASIPDPESSNIKRSDCDTIFIVANFISDKKRWVAGGGWLTDSFECKIGRLGWLTLALSSIAAPNS
jgi:hypothetical protein